MALHPVGNQIINRMPYPNPRNPKPKLVLLVKLMEEAFYILRYEGYDDKSITGFIRIFAHAMGWTHEQIAEATDTVLGVRND